MSHRYLIIGNNGNIGFTLGEFLTSFGRDVIHLYFPRQKKRCFPEEFFREEIPSWTIQKSSFQDLISGIHDVVSQKSFNRTVICCGELEAAVLIRLGVQYSWVADGADLSENPFAFSRNAFEVRKHLQNSKYIKRILTPQRDHKFACRILGLSDRLIRDFIYPLRPLLISMGKKRLEELRSLRELSFISDSIEKPTIFSVTRRVYSGGTTYSKGTEHLVDGLKRLNDWDLSFLLSLSGPDSERFRSEVLSINLPSLSFCSHLSQVELYSLFSKRSFIVLDQFGESESAYSGILRESMIFGFPVISDHVFCGFNLLKTPVGLHFAQSGIDIERCVRKLSLRSPEHVLDDAISIVSQALEIFDPGQCLENMESLL